jgi:flagellar hook-associated protein 2
VDFTRGIADTLTTFLDAQVDSKSSLTSRINSIGKQITSLSVDRERLNTRLESIQKRLTNQFSRLDGLISKLNSDSNFLKGQFDSLSRK